MNTQTTTLLSKLAALSTASSRGYAVAAENVRNRGLKIIFQHYARQRAVLAAQLGDEIVRLGGKPGRHRNPLAGLHRGWINLKTTMAIGDENGQAIVLNEVARGERIAGQRFQAALAAPASDETRRLLEGAARAVEEAQQFIDQLRGVQGDQVAVRLVDNPEDLVQAQAELKAAGFSVDQITTQPAGDYLSTRGPSIPRATLRETIATTALLVGGGGALLGVAIAVLSLLTQQFGASDRSIAATTAIAWPLIGGFLGLFFGALVGAMLGQGISEQDRLLTADSIEHGDTLMLVRCQPARARQASEIMYQVNVAARSGRPPEVDPMPAAAS